MESLNLCFYEAYTRLDKLCAETYQTTKGVTRYIECMRSIYPKVSAGVPNWQADLRRLVTLRHTRNLMSHEPGALREDSCDQEDVAWLARFYERMLNGTDPLSLLRKNIAAEAGRK